MEGMIDKDVGKTTQLERTQDCELEARFLKTKTRICDLFDNVANTNGPRRGMRRLRNIPEIRRLRSDSSELERLMGSNDDC